MKSDNPVLQILEAYKAAVYAKDVGAFVSLYDENVCVFDMWGAWSYNGIAAWRKMAEGWFGSLGNERVVIDIDRLQLKQTQNLAFVSAFVKYSAVSPRGAVLRSLENRLTCVLELKGGAWKITHEHTSAPAEHKSLKVSLER